MEKLGLIDVSLEDDFLVSPGNEGFVDPTATIEQPDCYQQLGNATKEEEARKKVTSLNEEIPELCQSPQRKCSKSGINLRKSLAWDSAFFTCEGVLNTEELATINTTCSQNEKPSLAGIPEEVRTSGESTTTLDTDNWTLESLESELFDNVRASIQKSLGLSEKDPSPTSGSSEKHRKEEGSNQSRLGSKEKAARASQNKMKVPTREKKTACLPPKQPQNSWKRASLDSKIMSVDGGGVQSKTASANAPKLLPKPTLPRTLTKTTAPPVSIQKRSSTGSALTRKLVSQPSQAPSISISRSMTGPPRCAPSASSGTSKKTPSVVVSKPSQSPSISVSRSMMGPPRCAPSVSYGTSKKTPSVASPNPKTKSPISTNKRVGATRTPTQASPKSKIEKTKPNPLTRPPSISPRSSIDSIRSTNTTDSVGRGSPVSLSGLNLAKDTNGSLSRSSSSSSIASQERSFKPSGLRMPSIKLGYFDGGKPLVNTPSLQKKGFFASPQINATVATGANTAKPASSTVIEDPGVTSQRKNCVEKENMTPMNPSESSKIEVNLLEEKISSLSLSQV